MPNDVNGTKQSDKQMKKNILIFFWGILLYGCHGIDNNDKVITKSTIDEFIKNYENTSFVRFSNISISVRQEDLTSIIYLVQNNDNEDRLYIVAYNKLNNRIKEVKVTGKHSGKGDFSLNEIKKIVYDFSLYKFCLLSVDEFNDVFINPYYQNSPPVFLRIGPGSKLDISELTENYIHYKNNWYIDKGQLPTVKLK